MASKFNIPKGWKKGTIGEVAVGIRGVTFASDDVLSEVTDSSVTLLRSNNIKDGRVNFDEVYHLPANFVSDGQVARIGDVAVCMSNGSKRLVGKAARISKSDARKKVAFGAFCALFRPTNSADHHFVSYLFDTENYRRELHITLSGSAINNLKNSDIEGIKIPLPPLAEQRKIAEILRTWDEAIETAEAELKAKQERKRGLMQRLLNPAAEGAGAVIMSNKRPITEIADLAQNRPQGNELLCVDLEHISPTTGQLIGGQAVTGEEVSKLHFSKEDVLFAKLRPYLRKAWLADRDGICSSEFWVFKARRGYGDPSFIRQFVLSEPFLKACAASSGSKMPRADWSHVETIKFPLPPLAEQRKIAEVLQSEDVGIDSLKSKADLLRTQKRGLMQRLLTGEVRVAA